MRILTNTKTARPSLTAVCTTPKSGHALGVVAAERRGMAFGVKSYAYGPAGLSTAQQPTNGQLAAKPVGNDESGTPPRGRTA